MHSKNVAHRDIKPENIAFDHNNDPKYIDFGLASPIEDQYSNNLCYNKAGTNCYKAPEIYFADYPVGFLLDQADIYSIGITLFVMKYRSLPYEEPYPWGILKFQDDDFWISLEMITNIPEDPLFKNLIKGMLLPNPLLRFNLAQVLGHPWLSKVKACKAKNEKILA